MMIIGLEVTHPSKSYVDTPKPFTCHQVQRAQRITENLPLFLKNIVIKVPCGKLWIYPNKHRSVVSPESLCGIKQPPFSQIARMPNDNVVVNSEQFEALGSCAGVKCVVIVGGADMMSQAISLANRPHIVVGTPGRLLDHLKNTSGFSLQMLKYLVLDEADSLLNMEFEKDITEILKIIPRQRRTCLFSATMTKKVRNLQKACMKNPVKIETSSKYSIVSTLEEQYCLIPAKHKDCYLVYILRERSYTMSMVFTRSRKATCLLALVLRNLGLNAIPISGQMKQDKRDDALNKFKSGECRILICTDVASRGLDIPSVDMVINYDIPTHSKVYVHRVGRTARAGRSGIAISLVNEFDVAWFLRIEKLIGKKLPEFNCRKKYVLRHLEGVAEAKRISHMKMKETGGNKRKEDSEEEEGEELISMKPSRTRKVEAMLSEEKFVEEFIFSEIVW